MDTKPKLEQLASSGVTPEGFDALLRGFAKPSRALTFDDFTQSIELLFRFRAGKFDNKSKQELIEKALLHGQPQQAD